MAIAAIRAAAAATAAGGALPSGGVSAAMATSTAVLCRRSLFSENDPSPLLIRASHATSGFTTASAAQRQIATDALFRAKKDKGLTFSDLAKILNKDEVFVASIF
ncbi:hypothetical protein HK405_003450, partial [Cladochytrium tenue]